MTKQYINYPPPPPSNPVGPTQGGTGITSYTTGDMLYASATNVLSKLAIGTAGQILTVSGGIPAWSTSLLPAGGTNGQIIQVNSSNQYVLRSQILDTSAHKSVDYLNRVLFATDGAGERIDWQNCFASDRNNVESLDWHNRIWFDASGVTAANYGDRILVYGGVSVVDWINLQLVDLSSSVSISWSSRILYSSASGPNEPAVDYQNALLIHTAFGFTTVDWVNCILTDYNNVGSVFWGSRTLFDGSSNGVLLWGTCQLVDPSGSISADWGQHQLLDNGGNPSIYYAQREIFNSSSVVVINYESLFLINSSVTALDWGNTILNGNEGSISQHWTARTLHDTSGYTTVDYTQRLLQTPSGYTSALWTDAGLSTFGFLFVPEETNASSGGSHTIADRRTWSVFHATGTLTTYTVKMPPNPANGQYIIISFDQTVTTLTVQANTGQTMISPPTTLVLGTAARFLYRLSNTSWYPG